MKVPLRPKMKSRLMKCLFRHIEDSNFKPEKITKTYIKALILSGFMWDTYKVPRFTQQFEMDVEVIYQTNGCYIICAPNMNKFESNIKFYKHNKNNIYQSWKDWFKFQKSLECFYYTNEEIYYDD